MIIPFFAVGNHTSGTILYTVCGVSKIPATLLPHRIKRTITKKAVEKALFGFVTREILTLVILKISVVVFHKYHHRLLYTVIKESSRLNVRLSKRASLANTWGADVFISIHCNASTNNTANGTEVYTFNTSSKALPLAKKIQSKIVEILGTTDRGTKTANFAVLRETTMPAVLVETAFISNKEDSDTLKTRQADFADAIFMAVCDEYNISYEAKTYETAEEILNKLTELIEIIDTKTALEQIQEAKDRNNSLYWISNKIVNR